ncbi:MAG: hypothetical protein KME04_11620 [Pleurocapsa minor GSE-CHR-MK-17-07R]|jgi:hypothetical protein|nr:hypothetical protein [Pleurocapsa minor GSE-CHR-MK 17-07R]
MPDELDKMNYLEGLSVFQGARLKAFWSEMFSLVRGKPAELLSFEEVRTRLRLREEDYKGTQEVELEKIVGSVGRYKDFTRSFLPKRNTMQERWSRVYAQANGMTGLPPIELYKVGDVYFVRDGNHRVSVARQLGSKVIQAHVTELPTSISLHAEMTEKELDSAEAYAAFLEQTGLARLRPQHQSITLSEPSRYNDLFGHIHVHRAVLSQQEGREVSIEEAAADWYDKVYRPAITLIRKYNVLKDDHNRTEGDLYLWMIDHLREMMEDYGAESNARSFSDALVDYLSDKRIPVPKELLIEKDATVELAKVDIDDALRAMRSRMNRDDEKRP